MATVVVKDTGLETALVQDKDANLLRKHLKENKVIKMHKAMCAHRPSRETAGPRTPQGARS